jgi:hypothetical protein
VVTGKILGRLIAGWETLHSMPSRYSYDSEHIPLMTNSHLQYAINIHRLIVKLTPINQAGFTNILEEI